LYFIANPVQRPKINGRNLMETADSIPSKPLNL
jgi:hypothetical protein